MSFVSELREQKIFKLQYEALLNPQCASNANLFFGENCVKLKMFNFIDQFEIEIELDFSIVTPMRENSFEELLSKPSGYAKLKVFSGRTNKNF